MCIRDGMSEANMALLYAYHIKGYRVTHDGEVIGIKGRPLNPPYKGWYRAFIVSILTTEGRKNKSVKVHRLQAYQKFGEELFGPGVLVRHLDGNPINNSSDNISLGTQSDNMMDRSKRDRKDQSMRAAQGIDSAMKGVYREVVKDRRSGMSYKQLKSKYGIPKSTLSRYFGDSKNPISTAYRNFISQLD